MYEIRDGEISEWGHARVFIQEKLSLNYDPEIVIILEMRAPVEFKHANDQAKALAVEVRDRRESNQHNQMVSKLRYTLKQLVSV